jgi:DNA-binding XRE family transcriptional regulator
MGPTATAVRSLRQALGYTQEQLAALCKVPRLTIVHIETDRNKATSPRVRRALREGFELGSLDDVDALLTGRLSVEDAVELRAKKLPKRKPTKAA